MICGCRQRNGHRLPARSVASMIAWACMGGAMMTVIIGCQPTARRPNQIPSPVLRTRPPLAEGQRVFMQHCNQCHVGGAAGLGPSLNEKPLPGFLVKLQVRSGLGAMPSFSARQISGSQLDDVVRYIKYLHDHPEGPSRS
jgi:mono/diheme cytochrome c family protein